MAADVSSESSIGRPWKIAILVAAVLVVLATGYWGRPVYRHFKEKRSAAEAQSFFNNGDYRDAALSARQALQINSNNVPAARVMARLADLTRSPTTLDRWQEVVKLSPTISDKLALAAAGLRYQNPPFPMTQSVLDEMSKSAAQVPDFHIVSAELALALHHTSDAETEFDAACKLQPTNRLFQLNLAVVRLGSTNAATAAGARTVLKQFCTNTNLGPTALRSLIADRLLHGDASGALGYSTQLLALAGSNPGDRLQHLDILKHMKSPELAVKLKALQDESATNAVMAAQLAGWMEVNGQLSDAIKWLNQLPANVQTQPPIRLALAGCYLDKADWNSLRDFASKGSWGEWEFMRLAFLSRAWGQMGEPLVADSNWRSAVSLASDRLGALNALLQLAGKWGMVSRQEDLLWRILRNFPDAVWAQHDLERFYFAGGDTRGLYRLYSERLARMPQNAELKNNLAYTALLLKTNVPQACQWAAESYTKATNDPAIASTYAYALHVQGRDQDALTIMQKLDRTALEQPPVALYYGIILSALGESNQAAHYLNIARTKGHFLPEEKQLLSQALK